MLIDYTKANVLTLPITDGKAHIGNVMLVPGINQVEKAKWDACKSLPKVKRLMESGELTVAVGKDDTDEDIALSTVSVAEATKIVKKTWNLLLLEEWQACEARAGVAKVIGAQIKLVEDKTKPRQKAANE